eukprot:TRINITY_DN6503_c0_g1_i1.p1 TRINITY_DN6503_c0_g1~~TRINITY_DN6503_c0_g1_i1.p1  ORF type:complete len:256 (-),score=54.06 TRINITY_DN6503_c0_g1_i1:45-812(-)
MIKDVWAHNLETEMEVIRNNIDEYTYVSMNVISPGVVARPVGTFVHDKPHIYQYQYLRCNVDILEIIQLGLTLTDKEGNPKPGVSIWQFNFKFNILEDMYSEDDDKLTKTGLEFKKHEQYGIDPKEFGELLISSGMVLNEEITWIAYESGYEFAYLLKLMTGLAVPKTAEEYYKILQLYFPKIFDLKFILNSTNYITTNIKDVQDLADHLQIKRLGANQSGSNSFLGSSVYFTMKTKFFNDPLPEWNGKIPGIEV